jgi:hypothetical protein
VCSRRWVALENNSDIFFNVFKHNYCLSELVSTELIEAFVASIYRVFSE